MPLTKRILFSSSSFQPVDQIVEVDADPSVQIHSYANILGTVRQLGYLSSYALEIFQNLAVLTEDVHERTKLLSRRTSTALNKLGEYDRGVRNAVLQPDLTFNRLSRKYLKFRELTTPPIFVKTTNYSSILVQYKVCRSAPQLWRIENVIGEDCFQFYSYPGLFFEEWLKAEIIKQELRKEQRRKEKALKKQQKKERKKMREELAMSFKRPSSTQSPDKRPRSLLTREARQLAESPIFTGEEQVTSEEKEEVQGGGGGNSGNSHSVSNNNNKKAGGGAAGGLSAVFGFLSKEKSDTGLTSPPDTSSPPRDKEVGDNDVSSSRRGGMSQNTSLSMQILNNKFKATSQPPPPPPPPRSGEEHDILGRAGATSGLSPSLFEHIASNDVAAPAPSRDHVSGYGYDRRNEVEAEEEDDVFAFSSKTKRRQVNYQATTKLGKYLSRVTSTAKNPHTTATSSTAAHLSSSSAEPPQLLLTKKVTSAPVAISLLPTSSSAASSTLTSQLPTIEPLMTSDASKARKRASVIFSSTFLNSVAHAESADDVGTGKLVEALRADVLTSSAMTMFDVLKENVQRSSELEDEEEVRGSGGSGDERRARKMHDVSYDEDFDEDDVAPEEMIISSSKPFQRHADDVDDEPPLDEDDVDFDDEEPESRDVSETRDVDVLRSHSLSPRDTSLSSDRKSSVVPRAAPPPPPPPAPPKERVKSAVGDDVLASIRTASTALRRVEPGERVVDMRTKLLGQIKDGGAKLRTVQVQSKKINNVMVSEKMLSIMIILLSDVLLSHRSKTLPWLPS